MTTSRGSRFPLVALIVFTVITVLVLVACAIGTYLTQTVEEGWITIGAVTIMLYFLGGALVLVDAWWWIWHVFHSGDHWSMPRR